MADDKQNVILDVRTPEEFQAGHIPGAVNLDVNASDFQTKPPCSTGLKFIWCNAPVVCAAPERVTSSTSLIFPTAITFPVASGRGPRPASRSKNKPFLPIHFLALVLAGLVGFPYYGRAESVLKPAQ